METLKIKPKKNLPKGILKASAFFFLFMVLFTVEAMAEVNLEEAQADAARNELLSYLAMGLGIVAVLVIAITTALKGRKKENAGSTNIDKPVSHRPFTHKHDHHHGRRGTPMRRR